MQKIEVGLGERSYPIVIEAGLLARVGELIKATGAAKRYVLIADDRVAGLFADQVLQSCREAGVPAELETFPHGEEQKNLATIADLTRRLAAQGIDRKDGLLALGGGVTGDITGFVAAIYMRGIPFIQIPTTLLAQVDSSVGGKTGVDIPEGKNLVGAFYQPRAVFIDPLVLQQLPRQEFLNGLAEVIKYGVIEDAAFFAWLERQREAIVRLEMESLIHLIASSCACKARVVAADEREGDLRRILNFGHTLGHAVEAASGYSLAHGLGVAMGMAAACRLARALDLFPRQDLDRLLALLTAYGLPTSIPDQFDRQAVKAYLKTDKKTVGGRPFFVLPRTIGQVIITDQVPETLIEQVLGSGV